MLRILHPRTSNGHKNRQPASREEIHPGVRFAENGIGFKSFPAKGTPKGQSAQNGQCHVEKKEQQGIPEDVGTDQKLRLRLNELLKLPLRQMTVGGEKEKSANLHDQQAAEAERQEHEEMGPGPGNAQVLRQISVKSARRNHRDIVDGIAGEWWHGRFRGRRFPRLCCLRLRVAKWFQRIWWIVVEEAHRFLMGVFLATLPLTQQPPAA